MNKKINEIVSIHKSVIYRKRKINLYKIFMYELICIKNLFGISLKWNRCNVGLHHIWKWNKMY